MVTLQEKISALEGTDVTKRATYFGSHAKGNCFSGAVVELEFEYEAFVSSIGVDQWFGFLVKFSAKDIPDVRVECDTLEDGLWGFLAYLGSEVPEKYTVLDKL